MTANDMHRHDLTRASAINGRDVLSAVGDAFARVEDVVVDLTTGRIAFAVVALDNSARSSDTLYPIPWRVLTRNADRDEYVLNVDKEKLENAPSFDRRRWPDMADRVWAAEIATYYGHRPFWEVVVG
ncbi:MAG: PRC-barrel domain-containing protein [Planctomycetes bacterium]|nr:PRC-barrel domain-containing protein [Planctomycetota bacterium]MBI3844811.1 PRC-barrel domain-containing protein [Planctomycetota bacterium]